MCVNIWRCEHDVLCGNSQHVSNFTHSLSHSHLYHMFTKRCEHDVLCVEILNMYQISLTHWVIHTYIICLQMMPVIVYLLISSFTGCMLTMYNWVMYACVHLALWICCFVWKFSCIKFHSLIHTYICIQMMPVILYLLIMQWLHKD